MSKPFDETATVTLYFDIDGGLINVAYGEAFPNGLSPEQLGAVMANLLRDSLGDEPEVTDVIAIQGAMANALSPQKV